MRRGFGARRQGPGEPETRLGEMIPGGLRGFGAELRAFE